MDVYPYPFGPTSWSLRSITPGMIVTWQGSIETIPDGWALCDGLEGRPNLLSRFIIGAGGARAPMDGQPWWSHKHNFTGNGHSHDVLPYGPLGVGTDISETTETTPGTGSTAWQLATPRYFSLAFIVKLAD